MLPYTGPSPHKEDSKTLSLWFVQKFFSLENKQIVFLLYEQNENTPSKETINPDTFKTTDFVKKHKFKEKPVAINGFEVPKIIERKYQYKIEYTESLKIENMSDCE